MSLAFDAAAASFMTKEYYTRMDLETAVFKSPALGILAKDSSGTGKRFNGPLRISTVTSNSHDASLAFTAGSPSTGVDWIIPWTKDFASANLTGDVIAMTRNDEGAFEEAIKFEIESAMDTAHISLSTDLWGNGGGSLGQISAGSNVATDTITLAIPSQASNFRVNQIVQTSTTDGTTGAVKSTMRTLIAVDVELGTLKASAVWNTGVAAAASDFIFNQGGFGASAPGIPALIPIVSPTGTFLNVNRGLDPVRTAGWRVSGFSTKKEALIKCASRIHSLGGRPSHVFMHTDDFSDLVTEIGNQVRYSTDSAFKLPQLGFSGIELAVAGNGACKILPDPYVPQGAAWMLDMSKWKFVSMGAAPDWDETDGLLWRMIPGADQAQARLKSYWALYCSNPGHNAVAIF